MSRTFPTRVFRFFLSILLFSATTAFGLSPDIVISQVYGGGGNSGATYRNDFIELFNRGNAPVSLNGWSVQQASAAGTTWNKTNLTNVMLQPGQYYLVQGASGGAVGALLPTPDATGTFNIGVGSGKIALVNTTTTISGNGCPLGASIVDFVGFGSGTNCNETAAAPAHSNTTADLRKIGGCTETDNNSSDFATGPPTPRNTATPAAPCLTVNINDVALAEGNAGPTTFTFTVSITGTSATPVTFNVATAPGSTNPAAAGTDYVAAPASGPTGIIPAGTNTSTTVTVTVNGDPDIEASETFFVDISGIVGASPGDVQGLGTITDDDSPLPFLNINDVSAVETNAGTTQFTFTVSLTGPAPGNVTFNIATANGTATTTNSDYVLKSLTGETITTPNTTYQFIVDVNGDTSPEAHETFFVNVSSITGAQPGDVQGQGTINNDDINLSINNVSLTEGNSGPKTFAFTVTATGAIGAVPVTFDIATANNTATLADNDYVLQSLTGESISAPNSTYTFNVIVNGDTTFEGNEQFFVNVTNVSGANLVDGQGNGDILDDDASQITIADALVTEGASGTQIMTFTVTRSISVGAASVDYATADNSATTVDNDYVGVSTTTLNFADTEATKTFDVTINGDTNSEGNEQFFVNLTNNSVGTAIADGQALGIIVMDDPRSIAAVDTPVTDNFDVLSQSTAATTPVGWTFNETGGGGRDNEQYSAETGSSGTGDTYSFGGNASPDRALGGLQSGSLIPTIGAFYRNDTPTTTFTTLTIAYTGEQWRIGNTGTARDDRLDFQYSLDATSLTTGTWVNVDTLDFTNLVKTAGASGALDGNAPANRTVINNTITGLSIAPGATFWIRFNDLDAASADDGLAVDDFSIIANITNTLTINDVSILEGNAGTQLLTFTVTRSEQSASDTTFNITTADGTATVANDDYEVNTVVGAILPANTTTYTFDVTINGDSFEESTENFFVNISNVTNAILIDGQGVGTINADDFTLTLISAIQGNGNTSPMSGQIKTVSGIVTGIKGGGSGGFFVQEEEAEYDTDANSSEGIFVFTAGAVPAGVVVGNRVAVTGTVSEFPSASAPHTTTELTTASVSLLATGQPLPAAITLSTADGAATSDLSQYERFEGMRVAATLTATVPTGGFVDETNATGSHTGTFYGVIQGNPLAFREPGIPVNDTVPTEAACAACIPRFDRNPQRIRVTGMATPVVVGQTVSNLVGPLDYGFFEYTIVQTGEALVSGPSTFIAAPTPLASELTVSSFNLQRFFDNVDDPAQADETITTGPAYANRLNKASLAIRNALKSPDVLGVVEVENLTVLQGLANKINADSAGAVNYAAYLEEGNDIGGIDVGFLVNTIRVTGITVTQLGKTTTFVDPADNSVDILNDRPPLMLNATIQRTDATPYPFTVIVNHLRSLNGNEGNDATGQRVREKRAKQAEYLAGIVQGRQTADPTERIILVGDFNAFQFNDGMVDVINTIKGTPTPATDVVKASPDLVNPDLTNLVDLIPAADRYSYAFDGNLQVLDHAIVNAPMLATNTRTAFAHLDAGFPEPFRSDANRPERVSDHDAIVTYFDLQPAGALAFSAANYNVGEATTTFNVTVNRTGGSAGAVSATYTIAAGTAQGADFTAATGTVNFANGETSKTFAVTIVNDAIDEPDQTIALSLSAPTGGATLGAQSTATITIQDDDAAPVFTIGDLTSFVEGNAGPTNATLTVTLTGASEFTSTVNWATADGTATTLGNDYTTSGNTLTFNGPGTQTINVPILGDTTDETDETVLVNLSGETNASVGDAQGVITIVDDDGAPSLIINDLTVTEGNSGTSTATLTITLVGSTSQSVTVDFELVAGTASCCAVDYSGPNGTTTFPPGTTTRSVNITIFGEAIYETDETVLVNLSNAVNATISDNQGILTITNDDAPPVFTISDLSIAEGNSGTSTATLTVTKTGSTALPATVDFATAPGTATAGTDYTTTNGTLTFAAATTTQTINVAIVGDTGVETNETVQVNLTNATSASIGDAQGIITINDDDAVNTADLVLTQTITPPNPRAGQFITLTLTVTNNGPGTATNVVLTDNTPAGLTISSVASSQGSCSGNPIVVCSLGTILNGANATVTIVFNPPGNSGTFNNTASVVSTQTDPSPVVNNSQPIVVVGAAESDVKIPTLSEWALIALALMLAAFAALKLRA